MKKKDVRIGMKVVPHAGTVKGWEQTLEESVVWQESNKKYLYVTSRDIDNNCWVLSSRKGIESGDFFRSQDFEPYPEQPDFPAELNSDVYQSLEEAERLLNKALDTLSDMTTTDFANGRDKELREEIRNFLGIES